MFASNNAGVLQVLNAAESGNSPFGNLRMEHLDQSNNGLVAQFALAASTAAKQNLMTNPMLLNQLMKNQLLAGLPGSALANAGGHANVHTNGNQEMKQESDGEGPKGMGFVGKNGGDRSSRVQARLARNRTTARMRRERKKQQAENLTRLVTELRVELEAMESYLSAMPAEKQAEVQKGVETLGAPPVACLFCDQDFRTEELKEKHVQSDHTADLKARQAFQKIYHEDQKKQLESVGPANAKLSQEERRKRRLERNAASARLCRQRKKQYIENLRKQVPVLRHKVLGLRSLMPKEAGEKAQEKVKALVNSKEGVAASLEIKMESESKENPDDGFAMGSAVKKVNIPRLSGWDNSSRRNSTTFGYESGSSDGSASAAVRPKDNPIAAPRSPKRRRGSESIDVASASPPLQPMAVPLNFIPAPPLSLSPLNMPYSNKTTLAETAEQQNDIFSAALALSNLGPISQKQV